MTGRTMMKEGDTLFVALSWCEHPAPSTYEEAYDRLVWTAHHWQHWLDHGTFPDHPWRTYLQRSGAHAEGAVLLAHRRAGGRRHHVAARDARRRAQLGLPLHLDPRRHVHAVGPLHARLRLGGQRLLLLHRRRGRERGGHAPDHVRDRRRGHAGGKHARPPVRLRGRAAGPDRQRRLQPGAARRLGRDARLGLPAHQVARPPARAALADPQAAGGDGDGEVARSRPGHLGDPRRPKHFTSSKLMCWVAADRGARLAEMRDELEFAARWQSAAEEIKNDILRERARRTRRVLPALRHGRARRLGAAHGPDALPAARRRAHPRARCWRSPTS